MHKNSNKKKVTIILSIALFFIVLGLIPFYIVDLSINSDYFIRRDFNKIFTYRITGNCQSFSDRFLRDINSWKVRCENEKNLEYPPIYKYQIQQISHDFGSDTAFLNVKLIRPSEGGKQYEYQVTYQMKRISFIWYIDQELTK